MGELSLAAAVGWMVLSKAKPKLGWEKTWK